MILSVKILNVIKLKDIFCSMVENQDTITVHYRSFVEKWCIFSIIFSGVTTLVLDWTWHLWHDKKCLAVSTILWKLAGHIYSRHVYTQKHIG